MQLSGFDKILQEMTTSDITYGGYSAAVCVLSPNLKGYHIVDDPNIYPYADNQETEWEGLGLIDWWFAPHFNSNHPESNDINKEIDYYKELNLPYKALTDGDVIIIEK